MASQAQPYDGSRPLKNPRDEAFCQIAVATNSIHRAYEECGWKRPRGNADRKAREPKISKRLGYLWARAAELAGTMGARHLVKAELIAHANMFDYWDIEGEEGQPIEKGHLKRLNLAKVPYAYGGAIQEISYDSEGRPKLKLHDATGMLKFLIERGFPVARKVELSTPPGQPLETRDVTGADPVDIARRVAFVFAKAADAQREAA